MKMQISLHQLPSKGVTYPEDMLLYVKPLTFKDSIEMERHGIDRATYYKNLIYNSVIIEGSYFNKNDLLACDVAFIDLGRKLATFGEGDPIILEEVCPHCQKELKVLFYLHQIEFTALDQEVFNKKYTFSDGLEIMTSPMKISGTISSLARHVSNKGNPNSDAELIMSYFANTIVDITGREFENSKARDNFIIEYIGNLTRPKDLKILDEISTTTDSSINPFIKECPQCNKEVEVYLDPSMRFQEEEVGQPNTL